jgi:competence protein ComGC
MPKQSKDFRGLTIFELLTILIIIGGTVLWALSFRSGLQNKAYDETRKARVSTVKEYLKVYILQNGSLPSADQFNDEEQRKGLFADLIADEGEDIFKDPKNPKTIMEYIPDPEDCAPETDNLCNKAALTFTLSDGQDFTKFALEPGKEAEYLQDVLNDEQQNNIPQSLTPEGN